MSTEEIESVQETGKSTGVDVTHNLTAAALIQLGKQEALSVGPRPTFRSPSLRTDELGRPSVSLAPGKEKKSVADMIKGVEKGIYIIGDGSFSIDQQRYNAQFGGQLFYEIKDGKITRMIEDVAYQIRTPEFWNACSAVCDENDYRIGGTFFDGKGQPSQVSAVSHGASTARFDGINVINTARSLG